MIGSKGFYFKWMRKKFKTKDVLEISQKDS